MDYWLLLVGQLVILLTLAYFYTTRKYTYWSSRGVPGPKPIPLFGNLLEQMRRGQTVTELDWASKYGKVYGTYTGSLPILSVSDPDLIKQVMVKDFNLFVNRRKAGNVSDETASKNLFNLEGDDWKRVRSITSPSFTSGKLRGMNALMQHCIDKLADYFTSISVAGDGMINTKEIIAGFTIDVVASVNFGTETNANGDRSGAPNAFIKHGLSLFKINPYRLLMRLFFPSFLNRLFIRAYPDPDFAFFKALSKQVIKQRREGGVKRNDFVQLLMDAYVEEGDLKGMNFEALEASDGRDESSNSETGKPASKVVKTLTDTEIIAQCMIFFLAGFETTSSAISHAIFHLAHEQEIQERLRAEIETAVEGLDVFSEAYYDTVMNKIPYLDAVIQETLRLYPPLVRIERRVSIDGYKLAGLTLEKDQTVSLCAYAVHRNAEYFPEPELFNPERFMPENKHLLTPYAWLPFGQGPRNCVGMRFAYQEVRMCLAKILPAFTFQTTPQTPEKMAFSKVGLLVVKPFQLKVTKRG